MSFLINSTIFFLQIFISTIFISLCGNLLRRFLFVSSHEIKFEEDGLYGFIFIGFIALLTNFFLPLNQFYNSIYFIIIFLTGVYFGFFKKNKKEILLKSFFVSIISFLLLAYSTVNRPDAWLYHLPYSSIINDSKIILGISNLHERFAHVSIFQYIASFFNNYLFFSNGIVIPISLVSSFFFLYIFREFNQNFLIKSKTVYSYLCFLILVLSLYTFNRYSEYGNDAQAHFYYLLFFLVLIKYLLIKKNINITNELFLLSAFVFLIKPTFLIVILIPIYLSLSTMIKNKSLMGRPFLFSLIFIFLWMLKNFFVMGCFIYPLKITCINNVSWKAQNIEENILTNEAWSKGWPDQTKDEELEKIEYINNFNWVKTWSSNHLFFILNKILPFIIFLILNFLILFFTKNLKKNTYEKNFLFLLIFSLFFFLLWFIKFPVYRLGISQIYLLIILIFYFIYIKNINSLKLSKYFKYFRNFIFIFLLIVLMKNTLRIIQNESDQLVPDIYQADKKNINLIKVYNNRNIFTHYSTESSYICGYSKSPCTHLKRSFLINEFFGYKIYLIDKNK